MPQSTPPTCPTCGDPFPFRKGKKYCSKRCLDKGKPSASGLTCAQCEAKMVRGATSRPQGVATCLACRSAGKLEKRRARQVTYNRARRATMLGLPSEPYTLQEVAERGGYACWLCGDPVDMTLRRPSKWCPSVDHVIPISHGGGDLLHNTGLAHWYCNASRSNRV